MLSVFSCRGNAEYEKGGHERDDTAGYYSDVCLDSELLGTADYNDTRGWDQVRDMGNESLGETKNISEREKSWQAGSGWTGTQYGEGQPGMGQSSLYQGPYWVGQPSQVATQGGLGGQPWTGTQYGEGQPGMGPSSVYQGARWAGQSGYPESSGYGQVGGNLPPWTRATAGQGPIGQAAFGGQGSWAGQPWTGTGYGEGQSGMGPSSLYQSAHLQGQGGLGGQQIPWGGQRFSGQPWTGTGYGEGQPGMGPSSVYQGARWAGQPGLTEPSGYGQVGGNLPPWTRATAGQGPSAMGQGGLGGQNPWGGQRWTGTQYGEGQSGMGPSSLHQGAHWQGQSGLAGGQEFPR